MYKKWNEKTTLEKTMDIISTIALCVWLLFEYFEETNKVQHADLVRCISICIVCICEAFSFWNVKRVLSYIAIVGCVFLIAVMVLQIVWVA